MAWFMHVSSSNPCGNKAFNIRAASFSYQNWKFLHHNSHVGYTFFVNSDISISIASLHLQKVHMQYNWINLNCSVDLKECTFLPTGFSSMRKKSPEVFSFVCMWDGWNCRNTETPNSFNFPSFPGKECIKLWRSSILLKKNKIK